MKEETLVQLLKVMDGCHWVFKGFIPADDIYGVSDGEKEYTKKHYGNKIMWFQRIHGHKGEDTEVLHRHYVDKYISCERYDGSEDGCFYTIKHSWSLDEYCTYDKDYHITAITGGGSDVYGCIGTTGECLDSEQSWKNICNELNEDFCVFYK